MALGFAGAAETTAQPSSPDLSSAAASQASPTPSSSVIVVAARPVETVTGADTGSPKRGLAERVVAAGVIVAQCAGGAEVANTATRG